MKECFGLIAAMPEEIRPLLKRITSWHREQMGEFPCYRFRIGNRECVLVESGIGLRNAAAATHELISERPAAILNFGFTGSVTPGPVVGDIILARRVLFHHDRLFAEQQGIAAKLTEQANCALSSLPGICRAMQGTFITTAGITSKRELAAVLPNNAVTPVVDMETSAVARIAAKENVPLLAIRAVSDGASEELGFSIEEFADRNMKIRIHKVLLTVAKKPWIAPQLIRLARNTKLAGKNLATAVLTVLENQ